MDMVRQVKATFKRAGGDATMQVAAFMIVFGLASRYDQRILADLDRKIGFAETGNRNRNTVRIVVKLFNIVRWVNNLIKGGREPALDKALNFGCSWDTQAPSPVLIYRGKM